MTVVAGWRPEGAEYDEFASGPKTGRFRMCKVCGGMHSTAAWPDNCKPETPWLKSDLPTPMLISDQLADVRSMHDGKVYDSKSRYYESLRRAGKVIVGNEQAKPRAQSERELDREIGQTVKDAVAQLKSGNLSNDQMKNMLREKPESQGGFHVE